MNQQQKDYLLKRIEEFANEISECELDEKVELLNSIRLSLHKISPFKTEPVDCVLWVKNESVLANGYNPNNVCAPEMELLKLSIEADGFTQPVVTMPENGNRTVIDGFHRSKVAKTYPVINERVHGYTPVVTINSDREDISDRMASTVRHNRARGKHSIDGMSDIVIDLKRRNWSDAKISKHLGMDADEVLRLVQITGLTEMFANAEFSSAWEPELIEDEPDTM